MSVIDEISSKALSKISSMVDLKKLEQLRISLLGKRGELTLLIKELMLDPEKRVKSGKDINIAKTKVHQAITDQIQKIKSETLSKKLENDAIDITLPATGQVPGTLHPITIVAEKIIFFFESIGFHIENGLEIETNYYNFEALNIEKNHPARALHDTFYFDSSLVLRTHTSGVQIRTMENYSPPIKMISFGKVYRRDSDLTHTPMFNQLEGLWVNEKVNFSNLKLLITDFLYYFFDTEIKIRFRPSYFPFTEPSAEVDISCIFCNGKGCNVCKNSGWLEVLGCGMVHPNVFKKVKFDAEKYKGLAFGIGIERLAMLYYKINDLRMFFENNLNFLKQF